MDSGSRLRPRVRLRFKTLKEADTAAVRMRQGLALEGPRLQSPIAKAETELSRLLLEQAEADVSLVKVVQWYCEWHNRTKKSVTVPVAVNALIAYKKQSPRYANWLAAELGKFAERYKDKKPGEITPEELRKFIWERQDIAPATRHNTYRALSRFYNFCIVKKWVSKDIFPLDETHAPELPERMPTILTVEDTERLMQSALTHFPDMVVFMALALFSGVRIEELCKLNLSDIVYNQRSDTFHLLIGPKVGKMHRARNLPLPANCQLWVQDRLSPRTPSRYMRREHCGRILPGKPGGVFYRVREIAEATATTTKAQVTMSQNVMRHSFASYYFELTGDAEKTRARMGHDSMSDVLFTHYKALVLRNSTSNPFDYFKITPWKPGTPDWENAWDAYLGPKRATRKDIIMANPGSLQLLNLL